MENKKSQEYVPRITQLDANELDKQISKVLKDQILEIEKYLKPGALNNVKSEIELFIKLLIFKYSLLNQNSTFGQQLLNLRYHEVISRKKAVLFALLKFVLPYLKEKFEDGYITFNTVMVKSLIDKIDILSRMFHFLNIMIFLRQGHFSNLTDRILGLKMVHKTKPNRNIVYNYMTRELLWHGFMELFKNVVPLINYQYIRRKIISSFSSRSKAQVPKLVSYKPNTTCSICGESPIYPCRVSLYCEHVACYYCIKSMLLEDSGYCCTYCGAKSTAETSSLMLNYQE